MLMIELQIPQTTPPARVPRATRRTPTLAIWDLLFVDSVIREKDRSCRASYRGKEAVSSSMKNWCMCHLPGTVNLMYGQSREGGNLPYNPLETSPRPVGFPSSRDSPTQGR